MDFVAQRLADGRWIRVLTVVDQYIRECLTLHADAALSGEKVAAALEKVVALRGAPNSITVDNGTEFASKAMDHWAYVNGVHLDFIRPGRPVALHVAARWRPAARNPNTIETAVTSEGPAAHQIHRHECERGGVRRSRGVRTAGGHDAERMGAGGASGRADLTAPLDPHRTECEFGLDNQREPAKM
jgi:Integrase core domain